MVLGYEKITDDKIILFCFSDVKKQNKMGYLNFSKEKDLQKYFENDDNENIFHELTDKNSKHLHIEMLKVDKKYRNLGVGEFLIKKLIEIFDKSDKYEYISLIVVPEEIPDNMQNYDDNVIKLTNYYTKFGFMQLKNKESFVAPIMLYEK